MFIIYTDICSGFTFPENLIVTMVYNYVLQFSCSYGFRLVGQEFINCSYLSLYPMQIPHCKGMCYKHSFVNVIIINY